MGSPHSLTFGAFCCVGLPLAYIRSSFLRSGHVTITACYYLHLVTICECTARATLDPASRPQSPGLIQLACSLVGQAVRFGYIGPPPHPPRSILPSPFQQALTPGARSGNYTDVMFEPPHDPSHVMRSLKPGGAAQRTATVRHYLPGNTLIDSAPNLNIKI